ncbi:hypothetical protein OS493_021115 [Desmophyllum pertusum]|uniref:AAA+ ATPase domain-containing protein n=1 Tax=Desmophyllum pertusum TaxID=174260 RepID=A0A9W9ZMX8_9CNID|nr:hypothetical protein OS493_021115 [Desmophyllum pertusum]
MAEKSVKGIPIPPGDSHPEEESFENTFSRHVSVTPESFLPGEHTPRPDSREYSAGNGTNLSHLPRSVRHFVNREKEIGDIKKYLSPDDDCRCVLVLGAIGMGKTATAIKAANEISDTNPDDGVRFVYVNCRSTATLDDLAAKIGKQLHHLPSNEPISQIKRRLIIEKYIYTVLLLDNFESIDPNENEQVQKFIIEIVAKSEKVKLLITSTDNVVFPAETSTERIRLLPFNEDDSFKLLKKVYGDTPLEKETAYIIARFCSGIPHVLRSLASWEDHPPALLEMFTEANPKQKFEMITKIPAATEGNKIHVCLDACFNRLNAQLQGTLVSLTLFRGPFTMSRAVKVFGSDDLRSLITQLAQKSFLEKNILDPTASCRYSLLTVNKIFCQNKALPEAGFNREFSVARKLFIEHYLAFLQDTFKVFLSIDVSRAINEFQHEDENILQLIDWFGENGGMDEDQQRRCIDVFNKVGELLAKMLTKKKFHEVFTMLKKKCEDMEDQKRLSECLTSLGIKEIFSCTCSPGLCYQAAERAKTSLLEADRIQSALGINDGNSRAQCLAKLGRCLAKNRKSSEGKDKIQQAIGIREALGKKDIVMLGATYNDLAVALSLEGDHREAIKIREQQTLPIYREHLGDHPFTATILNNLSNNFYALGEYDSAKQYSMDALKIRLELLKDHYDTAKSLFDLGMVHKKKEEFEEAKVNLEKCVDMQMKVLDVDCNEIKRTRQELNEVNNHLVELGQADGSNEFFQS